MNSRDYGAETPVGARRGEGTGLSLPLGPPARPMTLASLFGLVRTYWRRFAVAMVAATVLAFLFVALTPPTFVARAYIAPNQSAGVGGAAISQLQQLASLFSASETPGAAAVSEFTAVMESRSTAERLVKETNILQEMYPKRWDHERHDWRPATGFKAFLQHIVYERILGIPMPAPSADVLLTRIRKDVHVTASRTNPGLTEISYEARDPAFAQRFLSSLMKAAESTLLKRYTDINDASLRYVTKELEKSHPVEVRQALGTLVANELRQSITLASGRLDTVRVVLPAEASHIPRRPSLIISLLLFNLVGVLLLLAVLMIWWAQEPESASI